MRTVGVVTTSRADYGIYKPILHAIQEDPDLTLHLIVAGMHLAPQYGHTIDLIHDDGFPVADRVEMNLASDTPTGTAKSMGVGLMGFGDVYGSRDLDILLVLGDRFEMMSATLAALPHRLPVAHVHGGEVTRGAFDDASRHSITKLSHLHLASHPAYAQRIQQLGEEPWRVTVTGAPSLDNLRTVPTRSWSELQERYDLAEPPLLVTYHPVTLEETPGAGAHELTRALDDLDLPVVFTLPNADPGNQGIRDAIHTYVNDHEDAVAVSDLGTRDYFSMMAHAQAMVGNSSSGIIEAASFQLPVVNVGLRQEGRARPRNVLDVPAERTAIRTAIERAVSPRFRKDLEGLTNPYGDGHAAERIVERLRTVPLDENLLMKRFHDLEGSP